MEKHVFRVSWLTIIPHLLLMCVIVGFVTLPIQVLRILTTKIEVDKNMIYGEKGILKKDIMNSPIRHIQNVRVNRSLMGRIFRYGEIIVTTAGGSYHYKQMANPEKIRKVINSYM